MFYFSFNSLAKSTPPSLNLAFRHSSKILYLDLLRGVYLLNLFLRVCSSDDREVFFAHNFMFSFCSSP